MLSGSLPGRATPGTTKLIWHNPGATWPENDTTAGLALTVMAAVEQSPVAHAITVSFGLAGVRPALVGPTKL